MKKLSCLAITLIASASFIFFSCKSGKDKEPGENKTGDAETTINATAPPGPTSVLVIRHKVADYAKWLPGYHAHDSVRIANGLHSDIIARGIEDSNMVLVAMIMDDADKAKSMTADPALKDVMKKAGVISAPLIDYLQAEMNDTTALTQDIRLMIRAKVTHWDAWKKVFDAHKQKRIDAGLTDRVIAHTAGDTKNVTLVFAASDMEKAKTFLNSDDLKERMKESGVEGAPDIFFYKVVKKY
ncbi:MAG: hypothetical protein FJY20_06935 [Bacteroidetes bacterium]|nr:hypothetical protein [Bacteroidota bacterium]